MVETLYVFYDWFIPAYKAGGPIQSLANLSRNIESSLDINVICSNKDADGTLLPVVSNTWIRHSNIRVYYAGSGFKSYARAIKNAEGNVLFINGLYSWQFNFLPLVFLKGRKILSVRGMLYPAALDQKKFKKKIYLWVLKLLNISKTWEFHATSEQEKTFIHSVFGKESKVWVLPNFPREMALQTLPYKYKGSIVIGSVALISPMKNHLAVIKALRHCKGNITYKIYGPIKDRNYWEACKKEITRLPPNIIAEYCGDISTDQVPEALSTIHVLVQPSQSENFGHSIYEALASGHPVITSHNTPWNDLEKHSAGLNVEGSDEAQIVSAVDFFCGMDNEELMYWGKSSFSYVRDKIQTDSLKLQYMEMFRNSVN